MISLKLTDIKTFMNQLLRSETFDNFLLAEASISKGATFSIDGHVNPSFYSKEELDVQGLSERSILPYAMLRPACYQLMRGSRAPVSFKFILTLSPENMANTLARSESGLTAGDVTGMLLNISFQNGQLFMTTGISYASFYGGHTLDREWDSMARKFLAKHGILFEEN